MNKHGQSIIEYALIATLVILGIVFMGPYVLRSVNAHFKLWDDGVKDSFQENITQAPLNDVPFINATCSCTNVTGSCGSSQAGSFCPANEREIDVTCIPQGCNGASGNPTCTTHVQGYPDCCSNPVQVGCGTYALPTNPNGSIDTSPPATPQPPPPGSASNCYYGQQIFQQQCGDTGSVTCQIDPTCHMPQCQGFILFQNSTTYCATGNSTPPSGTLSQNTPNTYVGNSPADCVPNGSPCQVYCNAPYVVNVEGIGCALQFTVAPVIANTKNDQSCPGNGCPNLPTGWCAAPSTLVTSYNLLPTQGCGDPGKPSQVCSIGVVF